MFEVGKKVICKNTVSDGSVKRGKIFPLLGTKQHLCTHYPLVLDIGIREPNKKIVYGCSTCNKAADYTRTIWYNSVNFAPLTDEIIGDTTIRRTVIRTSTRIHR